jgi:RNA polymerase sigma-70 factor (ECF subfamily)
MSGAIPLGRAGIAPTWAMTATDSAAVGAGLESLRASDDRTLVRAFIAGDRHAFDVIVERHRRSVYQVCFRFMGNAEDAADLTQDVFVRAFRGLAGFKGDAQLSTWLYRVAVNVCLNKRALKTPQFETVEPEAHVDQRHLSADDLVARDERAAVVRRAIAKLPPKQRATLVLRAYQDLSHEEIARVLGSSVGAVKANFFHALGNLKRLLQQS